MVSVEHHINMSCLTSQNYWSSMYKVPDFGQHCACRCPSTYSTGGHRTRVAAVTLDNMAEGVFAQREDLPQFCGVNHRFSLYFWLHQVDLKPFFCYASWEQRNESLYIEILRFWFHRETRVASFCNEGVNRCLSPRTRVPPLMMDVPLILWRDNTRINGSS